MGRRRDFNFTKLRASSPLVSAAQQQLVDNLERGQHDTSQARRLLDEFQDLVAVHVADRDRLQAELNGGESVEHLRSTHGITT